jgi:hypothetical protein
MSDLLAADRISRCLANQGMVRDHPAGEPEDAPMQDFSLLAEVRNRVKANVFFPPGGCARTVSLGSDV